MEIAKFTLVYDKCCEIYYSFLINGEHMCNLFKPPINQETLDDWAKLTIDLSKVALLGIPAVLYNNDPINIKCINSFLLVFFAYCGLIVGRKCREIKQEKLK